MPAKKRASSPIEVSDEEAYQPTKKARTTSKPKKGSKDVGKCSLTKKQIGDRVKSSLALEKYRIPRMRFDMDMDTTFFRSFFLENEALTSPTAPLPSEFDETSPVVTLELFNRQAGEILGVSKIKGGIRYSTVQLAAMCIVFRPMEGKATVWLTV